jgi:ATP-dependent exoDNAse (exonuclease V) beta subunit
LPVWPAGFDKKLENSYFENHYHLDKFKQTIEAYNMMYVAFTRARKGLFVSAENDVSNKNVAGLLNAGINELHSQDKDNWTQKVEENKTVFASGEIPNETKRTYVSDYLNSYDVFIPDKQIKIKPFYEKEKHESENNSNILEGIINHKIFENIEQAKDLDTALEKLVNSGFISKDSSQVYKENISKRINHELILPWFNGTYIVSNEREIVSPGSFIRRPDRIMENDNEIIIVDYKFGDIEKPQYIKQTKQYASLLKDMGYENIKTYIWFVMHDYLLEVNSKNNDTKKIVLE